MIDRRREAKLTTSEFARTFIAAISERVKAECEERRRTGKAQFGGWHTTDYAVSYISAARSVLDNATADGVLDQMAAPCLYLQRHATELMLKRILDAVYDIESMEMTLKTGVYSLPAVTPTTHDLGRLVGHAVKALARRKLTLPTDLATVAGEISRFEDGDPTRTRYERGRGRAYERKSFPDEVLVPVLDWQKRLEEVLAEHFVIHEHFRDQLGRTMAEVLFESSEASSDALREAGLLVDKPYALNGACGSLIL